eukprot:5636031-Alexandrium_andersonii.AAC.1
MGIEPLSDPQALGAAAVPARQALGAAAVPARWSHWRHRSLKELEHHYGCSSAFVCADRGACVLCRVVLSCVFRVQLSSARMASSRAGHIVQAHQAHAVQSGGAFICGNRSSHSDAGIVDSETVGQG